MFVLQKHKMICFDVDDTLIFQDCPTPDHRNADEVFQYNNEKFPVWIHKNHVRKIKELKSEGYGICVWSQQGSDWAQNAIKQLGLESYVDLVIPKPEKMFDDLSFNYWTELDYLNFD